MSEPTRLAASGRDSRSSSSRPSRSSAVTHSPAPNESNRIASGTRPSSRSSSTPPTAHGNSRLLHSLPAMPSNKSASVLADLGGSVSAQGQSMSIVEQAAAQQYGRDRERKFHETFDQDAAGLITRFDNKLKELQAVLTKHKEDIASQQKKGERAAPPPPRSAARHADNDKGWDAGARQGFQERQNGLDGGPGGPEQASPAPGGRVKNSVPGLSRALSLKISLYRSSETARADLQQRIALSAAADKAKQEAAALNSKLSEIDFVRSNRNSLVAISGETLQQVQDSRCGTPMPPGALMSLPRFLYPTNHQRQEQSRSPSPGETLQPNPFFSTPVRRHGGSSGGTGGNGSGGGGTPISRPGSAGLGSMPPGWALTALPDDPRAGIFTPLPPTPETNALAVGALVGDGGTWAARREGGRGGPLLTEAERRDSFADGGWGMAALGESQAGERISEGGDPGRMLWIALTGRPASGGSPCCRPDYLGGFRIHTGERRTHAEDVRDRRVELQEDEATAAFELVASRIRAREEVKKAAQKAADQVEHRKRQLAWLGYIGVAHRLSFLRQQLQDDRSVRGVRELRKVAAVRIAAWYKDVLVRRRTRGLVQLLLKLNHLLTPHMASAAAAARSRAARRLLHFMGHCETSNLAVVAIRKFKAAILRLQAEWRLMLQVRHTQHEILSNALRRFERGLLHRNLKAEQKNAQGGKGKHVSIMPSSPTSVVVPRAPAVPRPDSSRRGGAKSPLQSTRSIRGTTAASAGGSSMQSGRPSSVRTPVPPTRGREAAGQNQAPSRSPSPNHSYVGGGVALEKQGIIRPSQAGEDDRSRSMTRPQTAQSSTSAAPTSSHKPSAHLAPDYDPFLDADLAEHREPLPDAIMKALVSAALFKERKTFFLRLDTYRQAKAVYLKKLPIEQLRLRLLRDAGICTSSETPEPVRPRMCSLLPRFRLKLLLRDGMVMWSDSLKSESEAHAKLNTLLVEAGLMPMVSASGAEPISPKKSAPKALSGTKATSRSSVVGKHK